MHSFYYPGVLRFASLTADLSRSAEIRTAKLHARSLCRHMLPLLALGCLVAARSFKPPGASIQEIQSLSDLDALLAEDAERQSMDPIVFGQFMKKQSYGFQVYLDCRFCLSGSR